MHIKEFERATGLRRSTIRFYERKGLLTPEKSRHGNGYRHYGAAHVERAKAIRLAQGLGFSLKEIAALIAAWDSGRLSKARRRAAIAEKLAEVEIKLAGLRSMHAYLAAILAWLDGGEVGAKPGFASPPRSGSGAARPQSTSGRRANKS